MMWVVFMGQIQNFIGFVVNHKIIRSNGDITYIGWQLARLCNGHTYRLASVIIGTCFPSRIIIRKHRELQNR